ncbi:MAG: DegT/DnrJ/EryC1/StrS family aminotransferase [bacterium]
MSGPTNYSKLAVDSVIPGDKDLQAVHRHIEAYCRAQHRFDFDPENPVVRLHEPTFSAPEIIAAVDVLLSTKVTMGPKVRAFEREFADASGFAHGITSNSGSSANLLAVAAITNVATEDCLKPGDEVVVPALSWSTTVWPLIQHNLVPVIVDIDPVTFNMDPNEVERAIGPKTRGLMPVHVYGNPCDMGALANICRRRNLVLIEDCCEALGACYDGVPVGKFGRVGTFSFYFSHHMTTLEGGITVTGDFALAEMMRVLRAHGWTRELESKEMYLAEHPSFDPRFLFINLGYNLRITEVQAAIGLVQLPKLAGFVGVRRTNTAAWQADLARWGTFFGFQEETPKARSSCFGFPLLLKNGTPFQMSDVTTFLNRANIETRPIICGNIAVQPAMKLYEHRVVGDLKHSTHIMRNGFSFGNHQAINAAARAYVTGKIEEFIVSRGLS